MRELTCSKGLPGFVWLIKKFITVDDVDSCASQARTTRTSQALAASAVIFVSLEVGGSAQGNGLQRESLIAPPPLGRRVSM